MGWMAVLAVILVSLFSTASETQWSDRYREALREPLPLRCASLKELEADQSSPIYSLATIKWVEFCGQQELAKLNVLLENEKQIWIHPLALELGFKLASEQQNHLWILLNADTFLASLPNRNKKETAYKKILESARSQAREDLIEKYQGLLWKNSPRLHPSPSRDTWGAVANDFKNHRNWNQSAAYFKKIFTHSKDGQSKLKALDGFRGAIKEKFRDPSAGGSLQEFLSASKQYGDFAYSLLKKRKAYSLDEKNEISQAWFQYGRDIWSYAETHEEQQKGIRDVISKFLRLPRLEATLKASAYHLLARVSQNYRQFERGAEEAQKAVELLKSEVPSDSWADWRKELFDQALWMSAFLKRKSDTVVSSLDRMQAVAEKSFNEWARRRGVFWLGRTYKQLGDALKAKEFYQKIIRENPFHYYALWARYDGGLSARSIEPVENTHPTMPSEINLETHRIIVNLVAANELRLARIFINHFLPVASKKVDHLLYRDFVGDHATVLDTFLFQFSTEEKEQFLENYTSIIFPTPYLNLVQNQTSRWPYVDNHYIYSIMRQESTFDPYSHSWADARGLLQLVPRLAEIEKVKAGVDYQSIDELFIPEINIAIGTAALDTRFAINSNNFIIATGSYNAGEQRVHRWWRDLFTGDVFEFLEEIPTEETRLYIRIVANNYFTYLRLHSQGDVQVPSRLFELDSIPNQLLLDL